MSFLPGSAALLRFVADRESRFAVTATIRTHENVGYYADTAEIAERHRASLESTHHRNVCVTPPVGSVNLTSLGRTARQAEQAYANATNVLRAGVLRAAEDDRLDVEIAHQSGVPVRTVREWLATSDSRAGLTLI